MERVAYCSKLYNEPVVHADACYARGLSAKQQHCPHPLCADDERYRWSLCGQEWYAYSYLLQLSLEKLTNFLEVVIASTVPAALSSFENAVESSDLSIGGSAAIQLCGSKSGYDGDHVFGFIATSNYSFAPVQQALRTWANATCLDFDTSLKVPGQAIFTTPLVIASNATLNGTLSGNLTLSVKSLGRRGDCTTVSVASGDGCGSLATKCGISPSDFTKYNSGDSFCSSLTPNQHVCCSAGTLPDFSPPKNSDGSCSVCTPYPTRCDAEIQALSCELEISSCPFQNDLLTSTRPTLS